MAIYAVKKATETNDVLQHRFKKQVQKSGLIKLLRTRAVLQHRPNRRVQRLRALYRERLRAENRKKQFYSAM